MAIDERLTGVDQMEEEFPFKLKKVFRNTYVNYHLFEI
jgi:hypothetical protein